MTDLAALFRAEGITVDSIGDWRTRVRPGTFRPVGILVHHTGDKGRGDSGLSTLIYGRPDLNGPLCTASPREDGHLALISAGRANHAGAGSSVVLDRIRQDLPPLGLARDHDLHDDTTGNGLLYGFEVDNDGCGQPYPTEQLDTTIRACAALCRHHGWTANRVALHSEWTSRKVDWSLPAAPLRAAVAHRLKYARQVHGVWTITDAAAVKPAPAPPPAPPAPVAQEDDVRALFKTATDPAVFITDGVSKRHVTSQAELAVLIKAKLVDPAVGIVDPAVLNAIPTVGGAA